MMDQNAVLTNKAKAFLTDEEIEMFNSMPRISSTIVLERQAAAIRLVSAGIQRKALFDIEARSKMASKQSNRIAALVGIAVILQVIVEIWL